MSKNKETVKKENKQSNLVSAIELIAIILAIIIILVFFKNTTIWNIVVLLLILTVLVFVHEGGHFIAAKLCGVYVYEFAIGMGPKVLGFKRKGDPTEYTIRVFPIGGFCQMAGEDIENDDTLKKDQFMCNKTRWQRTFILCAGVFMNFVLAFIALFFIGLFSGASEQRSFVSGIISDSPAYREGIREGDRIVEMNGYHVSTWDKLAIVSLLKNDKETNEYVVVHEDGTKDTYELIAEPYVTLENGDLVKVTEENTLEKIIADNNLPEDTTASNLIGILNTNEVEHGFLAAIKYAFYKFTTLTDSIFLVVGSLINGKLGLDALSGPVGMYTVVKTTSAMGFASIVYLTAYVSINLGVINILPIPAMDGGRLLFVIIEAIRRKKLNPKFENAFHNIGFILLMVLMLYITYRDVLGLI